MVKRKLTSEVRGRRLLLHHRDGAVRGVEAVYGGAEAVHFADVVDDFLGHDFAGDQQRDAGGVDGDDFGADLAAALVERDVAIVSEESFARRHLARFPERGKADFGLQRRRVSCAVILLRHLAKGFDQAVEIIAPVADADDDQHVERIGHLDLDIVLGVEDLRSLKAGEAEIPDGDRQLGDVEISHAGKKRIGHHFFIEAENPGDPVDLAPRLGGEPDRLVEELLPFGRHLHPGQVERRHQNVGRAGALDETEHGRERRHIDAAPLGVKHRRLRHSADDLVGALHREIGPGFHRRGGKVGVEFQMRAMRLIDHHDQTSLMRVRNDPLQIGADAVIVGTGEEEGLGLGMGVDGAAGLVIGDVEGQLQVIIHRRRKKDRLGAGEDQAGQDRLVRVPRDEDLVPRSAGGEDHCMIAAGGAVDEEERAVGAVGFRGELLRLFDHPLRLLKGIDFVKGGQVDGKDLRPDEFPEAGGNPLSALVAGGVERNLPALGQGDHGVKKGGLKLLLVYDHLSGVSGM